MRTPILCPRLRGQAGLGFLDGNSLDLALDSLNGTRELTGLVGVDRRSDDGAADTASSAEVQLGRHVDIVHVLVFGEEGEVEEDRKRFRISSQDCDFANAAVEGLGDCCLVSVIALQCLRP